MKKQTKQNKKELKKELKKFDKEIKQLETKMAKKYKELEKITVRLIMASEERDLLKKLIGK